MPAVAPDVALLRNEVVRVLRTEHNMTLQAIANELGMGRQAVHKLIKTYGLDGAKPARRPLNEDEKLVVRAAKKYQIPPPFTSVVIARANGRATRLPVPLGVTQG